MHVAEKNGINQRNGTNGHGRFQPTRDEWELERPLPVNREAERMILGGILLNNEMLAEVSAQLSADQFFSRENRLIFRAMERLALLKYPIDPLSLRDELARANQDVGAGYIAWLFEGVPRFSNLDSYIRLVKESAVERELISVGAEITNIGFDADGTVLEKIERVQSLVSRIEDPNTRIRWRNASEIAVEHLDHAEQFAASGKTISGMPTGLHKVDWIMDGMQKTDLILIGARPSMGKSSLVAGMALGAALNELNDNPVIAYFTLEMSEQQLTNRMLAMLSGVHASHIRRGLMKKDGWRAVTEAANTLEKLRLFIDDESCITPNQMRIKCRDLIRKEGRIDLIVCDYIQAMTADRPTGNTVQDVTAISKELKKIAKNDFNVPLIGVASMSRAAEGRANKRPTISDLRESGQLESDADVIILVYRDDQYNPQSDKHGIAELDFQKQRNGPTGVVEMGFNKELTKFNNLQLRS